MAPFLTRLGVGGGSGFGRKRRIVKPLETIVFNGPGNSSTSSTPFSVPAFSPTITITCEGEYGGNGPGGAGGLVSASFSGLQGSTLVISFAGGGPGSSSNGYRYSRPASLSRGGHYAGVFVTSVTQANSLIIAGGGGAGGFADVSSGGAGGGSSGNGGSSGGVGSGGGGGSQFSGGAGGPGYEGSGGSGSALQGGGNTVTDLGRSGSGAGGGGYYGGGGGGAGFDSENYSASAGGGGGSGFIRNDGSPILNTTGGSTSLSGKVTIIY